MNRKRLIGFLAAWVLALSPVVLAARNEKTEKAEKAEKADKGDKKKELTELRDRIDRLQRDLAKSEESKHEVADALKTSEKAISEVNRGLVELGREQGVIAQELGDVQRRIQSTRADVSRQQDLLDRMIRHQYMHGNTDSLRLVLEGRDIAEVERQLQYFGYVSKSRAVLIGKLKATLATLAELESSARTKKEALAANAAEQKKARAALQGERDARQRTLVRIATDIQKNRKEIGRLKRDEDRLTKLVDQLTKALARKSDEGGERIRKPGQAIDSVADGGFVGRAFDTLKGKLKLPVKGELAGRFGAPREEGGVTWKGLFIRAGAGQPIKAVADGLVVYADWFRGVGNLMVIDHGNGYLSLYGNSESLLKQVGETAQSGETIASVGSTGGALESGVYFELRHEGKPFDPMKWVGK